MPQDGEWCPLRAPTFEVHKRMCFAEHQHRLTRCGLTADQAEAFVRGAWGAIEAGSSAVEFLKQNPLLHLLFAVDNEVARLQSGG